MTTIPTAELATSFGVSEPELFRQAFISLLQEKKRQVLQLKLEYLACYGVKTPSELESKIMEGSVVEHPAWEDLIAAENLDNRIKEINVYLSNLQRPD